MKHRVSEILITVSIEDGALIANILPLNGFPACEVIEIDRIPLECTAWINILEKKR